MPPTKPRKYRKAHKFTSQASAVNRVENTQRAIALLKVLTQMRRDNPQLFSAVKDYVQAVKSAPQAPVK